MCKRPVTLKNIQLVYGIQTSIQLANNTIDFRLKKMLVQLSEMCLKSWHFCPDFLQKKVGHTTYSEILVCCNTWYLKALSGQEGGRATTLN